MVSGNFVLSLSFKSPEYSCVWLAKRHLASRSLHQSLGRLLSNWSPRYGSENRLFFPFLKYILVKLRSLFGVQLFFMWKLFCFLPKILNPDNNVYSCPIWTPLSTLPIEALLIYLREVFLQTGFRPAPAPLYSMATLFAFSSASLSTNTYRTGLTSPPHIRGKM